MSLMDALNADTGYLAAWKTEQACEDTYTKLQSKILAGPQNNSMINLPAGLDRIMKADYRAQARDQYVHSASKPNVTSLTSYVGTG